MSRRVLVFGHSHLGALSMALSEADARDGPLTLETFQFMKPDRPNAVHLDGTWRFDPGVEREFFERIDAFQPTLLVSMLLGDLVTSASLTVPVRPFMFYFPDETECLRDMAGEIVPFDIMLGKTIFEYALIDNFLGRMRSRTAVRGVALSPPPLVGDRAFILRQRIEHGGLSDHIARHGFAPDVWRLRIWRLHLMSIRAIYAKHGLMFLEPPPESMHEDGFLREAFRWDLFHGNAAYGRMLLRQIEAIGMYYS